LSFGAFLQFWDIFIQFNRNCVSRVLYFWPLFVCASTLDMVVLDETGTYDPYDSISELLDKLEVEARETRQLMDEPWTVQL
jgi:hypothetical protein